MLAYVGRIKETTTSIVRVLAYSRYKDKGFIYKVYSKDSYEVYTIKKGYKKVYTRCRYSSKTKQYT